MTAYHNAEVPSDEAIHTYYKVMNVALDEIPEFATVANKDKQAFDNMLIGFGGMLLAVYSEGKQNNDAATTCHFQKTRRNVDRVGSKDRSRQSSN